MNSKKISEATQEKLFNEVLLRPGNNECADCGAKSPAWVSLDFRAVICMNCAGAHRSLGPSVTRVRSMKLDAWYEEYFDIISELSNVNSKAYFESKKLPMTKRPGQLSPLEERKRWVIEKYVKRSFSDESNDMKKHTILIENKKVNEEFGEFVIEEFQKSMRKPEQSNLLDFDEEIVKVIEPSSYIQIKPFKQNNGKQEFSDFGPFQNSHGKNKPDEYQEFSEFVEAKTEIQMPSTNPEWNEFQSVSEGGSSTLTNNNAFNIMNLYSQTTNQFHNPPAHHQHHPNHNHVNHFNVHVHEKKREAVGDPNFISAKDFLGEPVQIKHKWGSY